jgi:hypothetical protein
MDQIVSIVSDRSRFPNIQHVAIIGHSSGGQFGPAVVTVRTGPTAFAAAANPSSYAYLFPMRFLQRVRQRPSLADCPQYNQWEWGLDRGSSLVAPYVEAVLNDTTWYFDAPLCGSSSRLPTGSQDYLQCNRPRRRMVLFPWPRGNSQDEIQVPIAWSATQRYFRRYPR